MHVTPERRGAAALEVSQHCVLVRRERIALPERSAMGARDVADLHAALLAARTVHTSRRLAHDRLAE
jgi:hypothetical protein